MNKKVLVLIIIVLIIILAILDIYFSMQKKPSGNLKIGNVKLTVEIADTPAARAQGLSGRDKLCETCGMLFVFEKPAIQNFWMKDMKFPLDMIFIRNHQVVEIVPDVPAPQAGQNIPRVRSSEEADMVLEVNAGFSEKNNMKINSPVTLDLGQKKE